MEVINYEEDHPALQQWYVHQHDGGKDEGSRQNDGVRICGGLAGSDHRIAWKKLKKTGNQPEVERESTAA